MFSKKHLEKHWSLALASIIYDVMNDYICHGVIRPYLSSERTAARDHCKALECPGFLKGAVLIFDRGYYSAEMFRYFSENGYSCVMRLKEGINLSKTTKGDTVSFLELEGEDDAETIKVRVRVIAVKLGNGTTEYLATNIFDEEYKAADFKELYFLRWKIESKYYELKSQSLPEEFNGATSISIEQEFFIHLLYANLASLVKVAADTQIDDNANPDNKYRYQANRAYIIGRMKDILVPVICNEREMSGFDTLFRSACKFRSQIQPGRNTPRKRVKNDRTHFRNRKTAV